MEMHQSQLSQVEPKQRKLYRVVEEILFDRLSLSTDSLWQILSYSKIGPEPSTDLCISVWQVRSRTIAGPLRNRLQVSESCRREGLSRISSTSQERITKTKRRTKVPPSVFRGRGATSIHLSVSDQTQISHQNEPEWNVSLKSSFLVSLHIWFSRSTGKLCLSITPEVGLLTIHSK